MTIKNDYVTVYAIPNGPYFWGDLILESLYLAKIIFLYLPFGADQKVRIFFFVVD